MSDQTRPAWASDYPSYEEVVQSWDYDVLDFETFGHYQGDHLALLTDGGKIGLIVFGYGSCSYCDALEAVLPVGGGDWGQFNNYVDTLRDEVHWEATRDDLRDWIDARPENHWWSYDAGIAAWLNANLGTHLGVSS